MRFPRTNLTGAEEISAEVEGEQLQEHAGEKPTAPIWQSNFSLAPNVRFTRTPENLINPKRVPAPPFRTPPLALQERVATEIGASVEQQAPVVANAPVEVYEAPPETPSHLRAEGRFTGAHEADQREMTV